MIKCHKCGMEIKPMDEVCPGCMTSLSSDCKTCKGRGWIQTGIAGERLERCTDCNVAPCGTCHGEGVIDSGGVTPWGAAIDVPCPECEEARFKDDAAIGASWRKDSSLEKWFPFSAKELEELKLKAIQPDEFGCHKHVAQWLAASTYRTLCHRHDGSFVAGDESARLFMRASTIPLLSDALLNWPQDAEPLPPAQYLKI